MRSEIRELLKRLGITAIYVTHDPEEAFSISDRVIIINNGKVMQEGTPNEIYIKSRQINL
jgi:ABC-type spermidine/putrescine transport systems, ATPase components